MSASDLAHVIEQYHRATNSFVQGDPEPYKKIASRRDDVTLANPLGPPARGWHQVEDALERAASQLRGGEPISFERISKVATANLAYTVEIERTTIKVAGTDQVAPTSLRVTTIFRREAGGWKIVHRHADPITSRQSLESVLKQQGK